MSLWHLLPSQFTIAEVVLALSIQQAGSLEQGRSNYRQMAPPTFKRYIWVRVMLSWHKPNSPDDCQLPLCEDWFIKALLHQPRLGHTGVETAGGYLMAQGAHVLGAPLVFVCFLSFFWFVYLLSGILYTHKLPPT